MPKRRRSVFVVRPKVGQVYSDLVELDSEDPETKTLFWFQIIGEIAREADDDDDLWRVRVIKMRHDGTDYVEDFGPSDFHVGCEYEVDVGDLTTAVRDVVSRPRQPPQPPRPPRPPRAAPLPRPPPPPRLSGPARGGEAAASREREAREKYVAEKYVRTQRDKANLPSIGQALAGFGPARSMAAAAASAGAPPRQQSAAGVDSVQPRDPGCRPSMLAPRSPADLNAPGDADAADALLLPAVSARTPAEWDAALVVLVGKAGTFLDKFETRLAQYGRAKSVFEVARRRFAYAKHVEAGKNKGRASAPTAASAKAPAAARAAAEMLRQAAELRSLGVAWADAMEDLQDTKMALNGAFRRIARASAAAAVAGGAQTAGEAPWRAMKGLATRLASLRSSAGAESAQRASQARLTVPAGGGEGGPRQCCAAATTALDEICDAVAVCHAARETMRAARAASKHEAPANGGGAAPLQNAP